MKRIFIVVGFAFVPGLVFAQDVFSLADDLLGFAATIYPLVTLAAVLAFFWGLAKFIWNSGDEKKRDEGKGVMTWGVIALFILVTIWGIIGFLQRSFGSTRGPTGAMGIETPGLTPGVVE